MYCSNVHPILEYAAPVWHPGLTQEHTDDLERIQIRAMKIAFPDLNYIFALNKSNIPTLEVHGVSLCHNMFQRMQDNDKLNRISRSPRPNVRNACKALTYSLTTPRPNVRNACKAMTYSLTTSRPNVRNACKAMTYPLPKTHTNCYKKSFLPYSEHFTDLYWNSSI